MKKFLAIVMVTFLLLTFSVTAFAEVESSAEEIVTEEASDPFDITVDDVIAWVEKNYDKISVIVALFFSILFNIKKNNRTVNAISTVNNNAVAIAKNSEDSMAGMASVVTQYKEAMESMLAEVRRNNEERANLEESLTEVSKYLKSTRLANKELGDEIAELLILANIPNSKKDELYARHLAAMNAITEAESVVEAEEVKENEETHEE
jgi:hypothetical protein